MGPSVGKLPAAGDRRSLPRGHVNLMRSCTAAPSDKMSMASNNSISNCPALMEEESGSLAGKRPIGSRCPFPTSMSLDFTKDLRTTRNFEPPDLSRFTFTLDEIRTLRDSFEILKEERCEMSRQMVHGVNSSVPGALSAYQSARDRLGDDWVFMNIGMVVMSGVERCLLRINSPFYLRHTVCKILTSHTQYYGVPFEMMAPVVQASHDIFRLQLLKLCHQPPIPPESLDKHLIEDCELCSLWKRFFDLLVVHFQQPVDMTMVEEVE